MSTDRNPILQSISNWFKNTFADPAAVSLFLTLVIGLLIIEFFGQLLLPVLISVVIAYMLSSLVRCLERWHFPNFLAVMLVYLLFVGILAFFIIVVLPDVWRQLSNLVNEIPRFFSTSQSWLVNLEKAYPKILSTLEVDHLITYLKSESTNMGKYVLQFSLSSIPGIIQVVLYFVLVPLLVFFFLKDRKSIIRWFSSYMPAERGLVLKVWAEVNWKIGAYIRGRIIEIIIVGTITSIAFAMLGLQYAILLGALVGLSVIIPYVGAIAVTVPIVLIGLTQWGMSAQFAIMLGVYALIIILDANVLVPLLFSEAMDLHPVVIILSVVIFGGIWGFWGVFFAIPLAMLVDVVLNAWPRAPINPES